MTTFSPPGFAASLRLALVDLGVHCGPYVIFGSAVMRLHGLRDEVGDVDLFVDASTYARLRSRRDWVEQRPAREDPPFLEAHAAIGGGTRAAAVHAFYDWTPRDRWIDVPEAFARAERVHRLVCVPLNLVAFYKAVSLAIVQGWGIQVDGSVWEKHRRDLAVLNNHGVRLSAGQLKALDEIAAVSLREAA